MSSYGQRSLALGAAITARGPSLFSIPARCNPLQGGLAALGRASVTGTQPVMLKPRCQITHHNLQRQLLQPVR
eukprot:1179317-Lingulodinium_polyedra.AAC.1